MLPRSFWCCAFSPLLWDDFAFVALLWFGVDLHADRVSWGGSAQAKVGLLCSNPVSCADVPGVLEQQVSQPGPRFDTSAPFPDVLAEKRRQLGEYLSLCWWNLPRQNTKCHLWSAFYHSMVLHSFPVNAEHLTEELVWERWLPWAAQPPERNRYYQWSIHNLHLSHLSPSFSITSFLLLPPQTCSQCG